MPKGPPSKNLPLNIDYPRALSGKLSKSKENDEISISYIEYFAEKSLTDDTFG
jgi:hypothetical protein